MTDFHLLIADWYRQNKRALPWRNTDNGYLIWLSEIILQQTRVDQGLAYYERFAERFPDVRDLAAADEQEVLKLWQGLGYYSRARNLHSAARYIMEHHNGDFPRSYSEIRALKGVGDYTAAAISSFAFALPYAAVDGNVYRVLSRYRDIDLPIDSTEGKRFFAELAQELLPKDAPGLHNQAIMEFGALQCVPVKPDCSVCPLQHDCLAFQNGTAHLRPVKQGKTRVRKRYFNYLLIREGDRILLEKRSGKDVWQNLFQLPLIETEEAPDENTSELQTPEGTIAVKTRREQYRHILSHQHIFARFFDIGNISYPLKDNQVWIKPDELENYPVPRLIDRFFQDAEIYP